MANCPNLFAKKYRIKSTRLQNWDYSSPWWYFVTICTKDGVCHFGDVLSGEMRLSEVGEIVADEWQKTERIRGNVELDEWVVMPNHLHGIIMITKYVETPRRGVSTNKWKPGILGSIINQFKGAATKSIHSAGHKNFAWQPRFYDHIIRDETSLQKIRFYVYHNAKKWEEDEYHPQKFKVT